MRGVAGAPLNSIMAPMSFLTAMSMARATPSRSIPSPLPPPNSGPTPKAATASISICGRAILSLPDHAVAPLEVDDAPLFAEPWQAEVLAIADALVARGLFSATGWASALGAALAAAEADGAPDTPATYYRSALAALEVLLSDHAPEISRRMPERIDAWRRAYLETPHGQPVVLAAALSR